MSFPESILSRLRLPVIGAPMFLVSTPELVIAQCKAGIIGSFPALNARPAAQLREWLERITTELARWDRENPHQPAAPFAVNQIVHKSNPRLEADLALCEEFKVPILITSLGAQSFVYEAAHRYGGIVLHDVISQAFARKAIDKGADGLIAVANGAGGHAGNLSPFAFMQELREWFDGPIALSGCIAHGRSILAAQAMGADLAYIGSPFIATPESGAVPEYRQMIVDCAAQDILYTDIFSGVAGNYLKPSIAAVGLDPDAPVPPDAPNLDFGKIPDRPPERSSKAWRDIWGAGQGIGCIRTVQPAVALVQRLAAEYSAAQARFANAPMTSTQESA